jgi:hypothetical protein
MARVQYNDLMPPAAASALNRQSAAGAYERVGREVLAV